MQPMLLAVPSISGDNDVDIVTSTNEAYVPSFATSVNAVYEAVKNDTQLQSVNSDTLQYDYVPVL